MEGDNSVQSSDASTIPADGAREIPMNNIKPDAKIDAFFDKFIAPDMAQDEPVIEPDEPEVSESEDDKDSSDDDSNVEDSKETEQTEEVAEEGDAPLLEAITLDDMIEANQGIEIDGKVRSPNDIKAAFGRQAKQESDRKEVDDKLLEVETIKQTLVEQQQVLSQEKGISQHKINLNAYGVQISNLAKAKEQARLGGDAEEYTRLNMILEPMERQYAQAEGELDNLIEETDHKNLAVQAKILEDKGYGELLSDQQRKKALGEYLKANYSPSSINDISSKGELLLLAEKGRLYDKAKQEKPKMKLRSSSSKSLQAGSKKSAPKQAAKTALQSKIDSMFEG